MKCRFQRKRLSLQSTFIYLSTNQHITIMRKLFHPTFFTLHLALLLMLLFASNSASAQGFGFQPDANTTGLKDAYKDYFTVGVAVNLRNVSNENEMDIIRKCMEEII